jgi:7-cyano-7-deazaguanine reductase
MAKTASKSASDKTASQSVSGKKESVVTNMWKPKELGRQSILTDAQIESPRTILEAFPNPRPQRDFEIRFVFPEFTSVCPVTGQPDFATITIEYVPDKRCVEMKSLKLYFLAYRNKGIFYEAVVNTIADDLLAVLNPRRLVVSGAFAVRRNGGRRHRHASAGEARRLGFE